MTTLTAIWLSLMGTFCLLTGMSMTEGEKQKGKLNLAGVVLFAILAAIHFVLSGYWFWAP